MFFKRFLLLFVVAAFCFVSKFGVTAKICVASNCNGRVMHCNKSTLLSKCASGLNVRTSFAYKFMLPKFRASAICLGCRNP